MMYNLKVAYDGHKCNKQVGKSEMALKCNQLGVS